MAFNGSNVMSTAIEYPLGYSDAEDRRLASQAEIYESLTLDVFRRAGISEGMSVLDVGCGVGDVSMLVAGLVGPSGRVVGVDRNERSLSVARYRARVAGLENVEFANADLLDFRSPRPFDAIVGRLVLLYFKNPEELIRHLLTQLNPDGIVAFHEMDMSAYNSIEIAPLNDRVERWIISAFKSSGIATDMGQRLPNIFMAAGLPRPEMIAGQRVGSGSDYSHYEYNADTIRSLLPVLEAAQIATSSEIDIETLGDRLRAEAVQTGLVSYSPRMVGAWATKSK